MMLSFEASRLYNRLVPDASTSGPHLAQATTDLAHFEPPTLSGRRRIVFSSGPGCPKNMSLKPH